MNLAFDASDARRFAASLQASSRTTPQRVDALTRHFGQLLQTRVMAHASGRPGPNVITGAYRRSIDLDVRTSGGQSTATVFSNSPQARRLELGAVGLDSLGRHMNSPPLAHFGPAVLEVAPAFGEALAVAVVA